MRPVPQVASVEITRAEFTVEVAAEVVAVVVAELEVPLASRYQFALGSPRHWPTVTAV